MYRFKVNSGLNSMDAQTQSNENPSYIKIANELLDDFHLSQTEQKTLANNTNETEDILFNQLEQDLSIKNSNFNELETIVDFDPARQPGDEKAGYPNLNLLSNLNKIDETSSDR